MSAADDRARQLPELEQVPASGLAQRVHLCACNVDVRRILCQMKAQRRERHNVAAAGKRVISKAYALGSNLHDIMQRVDHAAHLHC